MFHKKCGQNVFVSITRMFRLLVTPVAGKNVFLARRGYVEIAKDVVDVGPTDFYCPNCKEDLKIDDIIIRCMDCGDEVPLTRAYKNMESGLLVCGEHAEKDSKRLEIMARKISIKNV